MGILFLQATSTSLTTRAGPGHATAPRKLIVLEHNIPQNKQEQERIDGTLLGMFSVQKTGQLSRIPSNGQQSSPAFQTSMYTWHTGACARR